MGKESSGPITRQAANRGNENQLSAIPSSVSEQKAKAVSEDPLSGRVNDDNDKVSKEVTTTDRELYGKAKLLLKCN